MANALGLVEPLIPNAQENKAPEILLQGLTQGLAAFSRIAAERRQNETALLELAAKERIAKESHDLDREKIAASTELARARLGAQSEMWDSIKDLNEQRAEAFRKGFGNAAQSKLDFTRQEEKTVNLFNEQAKKRKLDDVYFQTKQPIDFAAAVLEQQDEFRMSPLDSIQAPLRKLQAVADQQKLHLRPVKKSQYGSRAEGEGKDYPIWRIVLALKNPQTREATLEMLRANGHLTEQEIPGTGKPGGWFGIGAVPNEKRKDVPDELIKPIMESKTEFHRRQSLVPSAQVPKSSSYGTRPTEMPSPDDTEPAFDPNATPTSPASDETGLDGEASYTVPGVFSPESYSQPPNDTDIQVAHARNVIQHGGASFQAVAQRLREKGIDPNLLWT